MDLLDYFAFLFEALTSVKNSMLFLSVWSVVVTDVSRFINLNVLKFFNLIFIFHEILESDNQHVETYLQFFKNLYRQTAEFV